MPLNGDALGTAIFNAIEAITVPQDGPIPDSEREAMWKAAANQIVNHFKANAVITTTGLATGVLSGPATAPTASTGTVS